MLIMVIDKKDKIIRQETDAIDSYFECVTACSLNDEGLECTTKCIEVHLKYESNS